MKRIAARTQRICMQKSDKEQRETRRHAKRGIGPSTKSEWKKGVAKQLTNKFTPLR